MTDHPPDAGLGALALAVDVVLLAVRRERLWTVVVRRPIPPHRDRLQLPGVLVGGDESLEAAARRALAQRVGVEHAYLEQLYTFGDVRRDPRTRVVSVAHFALITETMLDRVDEAGLARSVPVGVPWSGEEGGAAEVLGDDGRPLRMAFDHAVILGMAVKRLRGKLGYVPVGLELLPERFPLRALQHVHEAILGRPLNKDSFRKSMLDRGWVEATGEREAEAAHRPAELYRAAG